MRIVPEQGRKGEGGMDHYSYLIDREHRLLLIGIVLLLMAVVFTLSGEAFEPRGGMVNRAEEPKRFWWDVALYYLGGILFIVLHYYNISN